MKKLTVLMASLLALALLLSACSKDAADEGAPETGDNNAPASGTVLTVFNCYDYIDPDVIDLFEEETGISVKYCNYTSNEELYTKVSAVTGVYDVIFPSDYMIERMISEDMLEEIDWADMPCTENISDWLLSSSYDPDHTHSVPYMWGTLGILYNSEEIEEEIDSWSVLFDGSYEGDILMMNSVRDTLGIALKYLGYSLNTRSEEELSAARDLLIAQKKAHIPGGYLLDEVKDKMVGNEALIGIVYSGDAQYAIEKNEALTYVVPKEGSNVWVDGMCIPKGSKNKEAAMEFINFMCREDVAQMNFEYIYYCSPIRQVIEGLDEEEAEMITLNPSEEVIANCEFFNDVSSVMELYENAWMEVRLARP